MSSLIIHLSNLNESNSFRGFFNFLVSIPMFSEIVLVCETPSAHLASVPHSHVTISVVVPILSHRVETLIALIALVPKLIQMAHHVFFDVFLVHERAETEVTDGPIRVLEQVVFAKSAV